MDSSAAAIGPLVVLGVVAVGLLVMAVVAVVLLRPGRRPAMPHAAAAGRGPRTSFAEDDLPSFHARPPGSPGAPSPRRASSAPVPLAPARTAAPSPPPRDALPVAPFLLALAALALLLVAGAALVALPSARAGHASQASAPAASEPAVVVPALPPVPDSPSAGQAGAGELAYVSLPPGRGDVAATLAFGGVVMDEHAVGVTATYPGASLTTHGTQGLVHLRFPTWNCLSREAPAEPATSGCVSSVTEYADLPSPALGISHDGTRLVLQGRFPTYTRPNGSTPVYTGKVYAVTVTITPGRPLASGRQVAEAVLTLGSGTARTEGDPMVDVLEQGR